VKHPDDLRHYCRMLVSAPLSITSVRDPDAAWSLHVLDSLTAQTLIERLAPDRLLDVGSGGGSPGVPLAIELGLPVTLVEATSTKAGFLRAVARDLAIECDVIDQRSEEFARAGGRDAFPLAVSRALAPPPVAIELCLPLVAVGGSLILWLTRPDRAALEPVARALAGTVEDVLETAGGRHLLHLRKLGQTPERFPRRPGVAGRRPLRPLASGA